MKLNLLIKLLVVQGFCLISGQSNEKTVDDLDCIRPSNRTDANKLTSDDPTPYFGENSLANTFDQRVSFDQYIDYAMRALALVVSRFELYRYDDKYALINSYNRNLSSAQSEDEHNQVECGLQLDAITQVANRLFSSSHEFSQSRELSFIDYLDSFGGPSAQFMQGNFQWLGSYEQCLKAKLFLPLDEAGARQEVGSRYCIAKFRPPSWPAERMASVSRIRSASSIELGVCLPKSCNSISSNRHIDRIEPLIKLVRLNQVPFSSFRLVQLHCLPDEDSPLRQFTVSAKIFIVSLVIWLTLLIYFSLKYEYQRMKWLSKTGNSLTAEFDANLANPIKIFALRLSWSKLFKISAQRHQETHPDLVSDSNNNQAAGEEILPPAGQQEAMKSSNILKEAPEVKSVIRKRKPPANLLNVSQQQDSANNEQYGRPSVSVNQGDRAQIKPSNASSPIDLSAINGLKVLSMIWIISSHTLLFSKDFANGRDFWSMCKDTRFIPIIAGIFPVDTFFTVTGILTAYLGFSTNNGGAMRKISSWLQAFVHLYLKFMPMYLIVFWYTRDVSEYIGNGPLWDYATADTSFRSVCKQESISVPLLLQAIFKPVDQHCVKPAWYLANSYLYLLLTPFFFGLIMKSRSLGYSVIVMAILASLISQFANVYQSVDLDFGAIMNYKPIFPSYVIVKLWRLYVLPHNRIAPYLIGIITGHMIFNRSRAINGRKNQVDSKLEQTKNSTSSCGPKNSLASGDETSHREPTNVMSDPAKSYTKQFLTFTGDLNNYLCLKVWAPIMFQVSIIYFPMITSKLGLEGQAAKIGASAAIALARFSWSMAIARLVYICSTRFVRNSTQKFADDSIIIRFLSSPKWEPWSRLGLSALLIQFETILYLAQIQTSAYNMTLSFTLARILLSLAVSYPSALIMYLTLEYPLSQVVQLYLYPAIFRRS